MLNVTEVRDSDFKNALPGIFCFTVGILFVSLVLTGTGSGLGLVLNIILVLEPRHLDIYNIARKIVITNQQERYAKLAPHRAEARISLLIQSKTKIGFEVSGGVENSLPIYCREVSFQTVRRSQYNPQGYR